jgi:hypothetical protein
MKEVIRMNQKHIDEQINIWKKRVFFPNEVFKKDTKANLLELENYFKKSREKFIIISAETESCVYKIGRFFVEHGLNNESIEFQDGEVFNSYIDIETKYRWQSRQLFDELLKIISPNVKKKFLIIPDLNNSWDKTLAIYFITKLEQLDCLGLLFYSNKDVPDNFAQILCEETYTNIIQFPKANYKTKALQHSLEDDGY